VALASIQLRHIGAIERKFYTNFSEKVTNVTLWEHDCAKKLKHVRKDDKKAQEQCTTQYNTIKKITNKNKNKATSFCCL